MKDKHAAEDIWHLTIDDLLAPPPEKPRLGGPGPFVINLSASTAPISIPPKSVLNLERMHVYQVTRTEDGRQRFRLRLGPISTELEADALLASLREVYPGAMTAIAADDDLRAIASAARIAESGARPALRPPPKSSAKPQARRLPIPPQPVVKNEALETTGSGWDLDVLLPHLAAKTPAPPMKKAPPKKPVEAQQVAAARAPAPQVPAPRTTPAPRAKPPIAPAAKAAAPAKKAQAPVMKPVSAPPAAGHSAPTEWYEATQPMNAAPAAQVPVASIPVLSIPVLHNEVMPGTGEIVPTVVIEKAQAPQSTRAVPASPVIEPVAVVAAPEPFVRPEPAAASVAPESVRVVAAPEAVVVAVVAAPEPVIAVAAAEPAVAVTIPEPVVVAAAPEPVAAVAVPAPVAVVASAAISESVPAPRVDADAVAAVAAAPAAASEVVAVPIFTPIAQEFGPSAFGHKIELTGRFTQVDPATQPQNIALEPLPDPLETDWAAILSAPIEATGTRPALSALLESAVVPATAAPAIVAAPIVAPATAAVPMPAPVVTPAATVAPAHAATDDDSGLTKLVAKSNALVESLDSQFDPATTVPATIAADPRTAEPAQVARATIEPAAVGPAEVAPTAVEAAVVVAPVDEFVAVEQPAFTSTQTIEQKLAALAGILAEVEALPATPAPVAVESTPAAASAATIDANAQSGRAPVLQTPVEDIDVDISLDDDILSPVRLRTEPWPEIERRQEPRPSLKSPAEVLSAIEDMVVVDEANNLENIVEKVDAAPAAIATHVEAPAAAPAPAASVPTASAPPETALPASSVPLASAAPVESTPAATAAPIGITPVTTAAPVEITPIVTAAPVEAIASAAPAPVEDIVAAPAVPAVQAAQPRVAPIVFDAVIDEIVVAEVSVDIASSVEVLMLKTSAVLDALDAPAEAAVATPEPAPASIAAQEIVPAPLQEPVLGANVVTPSAADRVPAPRAEPVPAPAVGAVVAPAALASAGFIEYVEPTVVLEPKESTPAPAATAPEPIVLSLAPDEVPATSAARDATPARAAPSIDLELVADAPARVPEVASAMAAPATVKETRQAPTASAAAPLQQAKNNAVPPGAVRGARPAKKARHAGKQAKPSSTIIAPAKAAAPVMRATPPATKVAPPAGRPQTPATSAKPHAPAHAAMPAAAAAHQARAAKPAERKAATDTRPAPAVDSTQTLHSLAPLDLAQDDASRWFVVQLELSQNEIDPEHVPSLDIFEAYRLYTVMGLIDGKLMHALRLGFFNDDISAQAVAAYLKSFFEAPAIKRVSSAERERFAERQVVPRKDVGATGLHSVIEMSSPRPVPEKRLADLTEGTGQRAPEEKSIWSRLVAPLKR